MTDEIHDTLPFLTRVMLKFGKQAKIEVQIASYSLSTNVLEITGITRDGPFTYPHVPDGDGTRGLEKFPLTDIPIMLSVNATSQTSSGTKAYAVVKLIVNGEPVAELCSGEISAGKGISFPVSNSQRPNTTFGEIEHLTFSNPSVGNELSSGATQEEVWRIQAIRFRFVTDANAADRRVHLILQSSVATFIEVFASINQTANLTRDYTCAAFGTISDEADDNDILISLPSNLYVPAATDIQSETVNIQAGDQFSQFRAVVDRYYET